MHEQVGKEKKIDSVSVFVGLGGGWFFFFIFVYKTRWKETQIIRRRARKLL